MALYVRSLAFVLHHHGAQATVSEARPKADAPAEARYILARGLSHSCFLMPGGYVVISFPSHGIL